MNAPASFLQELVGSMSQGAAGNQGIVAVQYWMGIEPDAVVMRQALERALGL